MDGHWNLWGTRVIFHLALCRRKPSCHPTTIGGVLTAPPPLACFDLVFPSGLPLLKNQPMKKPGSPHLPPRPGTQGPRQVSPARARRVRNPVGVTPSSSTLFPFSQVTYELGYGINW